MCEGGCQYVNSFRSCKQNAKKISHSLQKEAAHTTRCPFKPFSQSKQSQIWLKICYIFKACRYETVSRMWRLIDLVSGLTAWCFFLWCALQFLFAALLLEQLSANSSHSISFLLISELRVIHFYPIVIYGQWF